MRKGSIDSYGRLSIMRPRSPKPIEVAQACPFQEDMLCGDWCPFFTDIPETQEKNIPGQMVRLSCMNEWPADCIDIVKDERKPSKGA